MYRKINKGDTIKNFKPRRMVLAGSVYEVDSVDYSISLNTSTWDEGINTITHYSYPHTFTI